MENNNKSSTGIGILGCLQVVLIVLKCFHLINCTWVQVFIPTFISIGCSLIVLIVVGILLIREKDKWD